MLHVRPERRVTLAAALPARVLGSTPSHASGARAATGSVTITRALRGDATESDRAWDAASVGRLPFAGAFGASVGAAAGLAARVVQHVGAARRFEALQREVVS